MDFQKSPFGAWIYDRNVIGGCFVTHFQDLFSSSNHVQSGELPNLFDPSMFDDDNATLNLYYSNLN